MACPTTSVTLTTTELTVQAVWDKKNDKALGAIQLYVAQNLHHIVDNEYAKPGVVGTYMVFQQFINTQLFDASALGPQIDAIIKKAT